MSYDDIFLASTKGLKDKSLYRSFKTLDKKQNTFPIFKDEEGKDVCIWCTNDYLGLSCNEDVIQSAIESIKNNGIGSGGTRNISGTNSSIVNLEKKVAKFHNKEMAIVFTSGYMANFAAISVIAKLIPDITFISDEKNHASIIEGIRHNNVNKLIFRHNDVDHLHECLKSLDKKSPKMIIIEGVYSMDGTAPNLVKIVELAKKYNALTYIDEVHAVGIYGSNGSGIAKYFNLDHEIDIIQGTFSKAIGTIGGYVAGNNAIIDAIRSHANGFIFTTSLPACICDATSTSIDFIESKSGKNSRKNLLDIASYIKDKFRQHNIDFIDNAINTHIIPVMIYDENKAVQISNNIMNKYGIYIQSIRYPTVPIGGARLRITPSAKHTFEMADKMIEAVIEENLPLEK